MREYGGNLIEPFFEEEFFEHEQYAEEETPYYEVPSGAVPEARDKPYYEYIENPSAEFHAVAAERDIDIIAEPAAQRHMPAAPEFGDCL